MNYPIFGKNAPSNKVTLGVICVNSRGAYLVECFSKLHYVEIAYICDVEEKAIANGLKPFEKSARRPIVINDIRKLLKKQDFEALIIAKPDHWQTTPPLMAVPNGKHV